MASNSPWSVKGISPEDREVAKVAARKAGVPIGVWLSEKIRQAGEDKPEEDNSDKDTNATGDPKDDPRHPANFDPRFALGAGQWRTAEHLLENGIPPMTAAAGQMYLNQSFTPPMPSHDMPVPMPQPVMQAVAPQPVYQAAPPPPPAPPPAAEPAVPAVDDGKLRELQQKFQTLEEKFNATEHKLAEAERQLIKAEQLRQEAVKPAMMRIEELEEEIADLRIKAGQAQTGTSTAPIERAVMRIAERLQKVEDLTLPESEGGFFSRLFRRKS